MQTRSQTKKLVAIAKEPEVKDTFVSEPLVKEPEVKDTFVSEPLVKDPEVKEQVAKDTMLIETHYRKPLYDVDIDFDEASIAWRANKKSIGNGQFKYKKWTKLNN
jgi:hypothetical protein